MNKNKKYIMNTKRLGFRHFEKNDLDYFAQLNSDPNVRQFFPDGVQTREQTEARMNDFVMYYEERGLPCFVMVDLETEEFVGRCGFGLLETDEIEVDYLLHKKFWRRGLASEALIFLLEWAKENINSEYIIAYAPINRLSWTLKASQLQIFFDGRLNLALR